MRRAGIAQSTIDAQQARLLAEQIYKNDKYQVNIGNCPVPEGWPAMLHLSIKRIDRAWIHDWRELQQIKNELVGSENEAVELYPAESRLCDSANQYHLWVFVDPAHSWPFGYNHGRTVFDGEVEPATGAIQRPFDKAP